ncbi:MAG: DUF4129 domain-containing protein, partial [Steroidobacteraceae bacterium]
YWYITQADAHAWSEIWLEGSGWQRVDPTAVVAPDRLDGALGGAFAEARAANEGWLARLAWVENLQFAWDAANTWWRDQVVRFDRFKQQALLEWLGIPEPDWRRLGMLLTAGLVAFLIWLTWVLRRELTPRARDPLVTIYARFCRTAERAGLTRRPDEGPVDFAQRLKEKWPGSAREIDGFTERFVRARYLAPAENGDLGELSRLARALRLQAA